MLHIQAQFEQGPCGGTLDLRASVPPPALQLAAQPPPGRQVTIDHINIRILHSVLSPEGDSRNCRIPMFIWSVGAASPDQNS